MSARDWKVCPRCRRIHAERKAELEKQVRELYGSLALPEFDALRQQAAQPFDETPPPTHVCAVCGEPIHFANGQWRDDDGRFEVGIQVPCDHCASAKARGRTCQTCLGTGYRKQFDHTHTAEVPS